MYLHYVSIMPSSPLRPPPHPSSPPPPYTTTFQTCFFSFPAYFTLSPLPHPTPPPLSLSLLTCHPITLWLRDGW